MDAFTAQSSLSTKAQQARQLFRYETFGDGYCFDFDRYGWEGIRASPWYEPLSRAIADFSGDAGFAYAEVVTALDALSDWSDDADPQECVDQEATIDVYTSDLVDWLALSLYHVDYLTQAAAEYSVTDGYQLLAAAQEIAKREIWDGVVQALTYDSAI